MAENVYIYVDGRNTFHLTEAASSDLVDSIDREFRAQDYAELPNASYELIPHLTWGKTVQLTALRLVEIAQGRLEQKVTFDCAVDEVGQMFLAKQVDAEGQYRLYPVDQHTTGLFHLFGDIACRRAQALN